MSKYLKAQLDEEREKLEKALKNRYELKEINDEETEIVINITKDQKDENGWKIRLTTDVKKEYVGVIDIIFELQKKCLNGNEVINYKEIPNRLNQEQDMDLLLALSNYEGLLTNYRKNVYESPIMQDEENLLKLMKEKKPDLQVEKNRILLLDIAEKAVFLNTTNSGCVLKTQNQLINHMFTQQFKTKLEQEIPYMAKNFEDVLKKKNTLKLKI